MLRRNQPGRRFPDLKVTPSLRGATFAKFSSFQRNLSFLFKVTFHKSENKITTRASPWIEFDWVRLSSTSESSTHYAGKFGGA